MMSAAFALRCRFLENKQGGVPFFFYFCGKQIYHDMYRLRHILKVFSFSLLVFGLCPQLLHAQSMQELRHSAELGNAEAQFALGDCYFHGNGVEQNYAEAEMWYRRATAQWYALAKMRRDALNLKSEASFSGNWSQFLLSHLKYPDKALNENVQGTVMVEFIVETDGSVSDVKVLRSVSKECDDEAVRVVKLGKWSPAVDNNDQKVRTRFLQPITFRLEE